MIEKTGIIGGLDLPEKAEHTRERETDRDAAKFYFWYLSTMTHSAYNHVGVHVSHEKKQHNYYHIPQRIYQNICKEKEHINAFPQFSISDKSLPAHLRGIIQ